MSIKANRLIKHLQKLTSSAFGQAGTIQSRVNLSTARIFKIFALHKNALTDRSPCHRSLIAALQHKLCGSGLVLMTKQADQYFQHGLAGDAACGGLFGSRKVTLFKGHFHFE